MRVTLLQPIAGAAGTERIYVVDASLSGVRLSHLTLFQQRDDCRIEFEWDSRPIQFAGQVRWTKLQKIGSAAFSKSVYQSGLEIAAISPPAHEALRGLIESHIERHSTSREQTPEEFLRLTTSQRRAGRRRNSHDTS